MKNLYDHSNIHDKKTILETHTINQLTEEEQSEIILEIKKFEKKFFMTKKKKKRKGDRLHQKLILKKLQRLAIPITKLTRVK
ncbi:hypothetical protein GVAV_000995 [Gurleya vavrai]